MKISIFGSCIKNVWLVGVVTQNFHRHSILVPPPQLKSHSYTYAICQMCLIEVCVPSLLPVVQYYYLSKICVYWTFEVYVSSLLSVEQYHYLSKMMCAYKGFKISIHSVLVHSVCFQFSHSQSRWSSFHCNMCPKPSTIQ